MNWTSVLFLLAYWLNATQNGFRLYVQFEQERRKENNWKPKNKNKNKNNENKKVSKQTSEAKQITENQQKPDKLIISPGSPAVHRPSPVFPIVWLNYIIYRVYLTFKLLFWIPIWSLWVIIWTCSYYIINVIFW
jgi:hypothetical protein